MKQRIKRVLLALCMAACLFSLSACTKAADVAESVLDETTASYLNQVTEGLLMDITSLDVAQAEEMEASLLRNDQDVLASGVVSWVGVMNDTGRFVSVISSEAEETEEGDLCSVVQAQFEKRNVEFKVFYEMSGQSMAPTSISFSPEYTTGENMTKAAMNTIMGMGTVFAVLIFISLLIGCFKYINAWENSRKAKTAPVAVPAPAVAAPAIVEEEEELADDLELVAVITAAIAAATNSSTDGLVVRSIRRAPGAKWKRS